MYAKILKVAALGLILSVPVLSKIGAPKSAPNPEIAKMVKEVSAKNIEATIRSS